MSVGWLLPLQCNTQQKRANKKVNCNPPILMQSTYFSILFMFVFIPGDGFASWGKMLCNTFAKAPWFPSAFSMKITGKTKKRNRFHVWIFRLTYNTVVNWLMFENRYFKVIPLIVFPIADASMLLRTAGLGILWFYSRLANYVSACSRTLFPHATHS